MGYTNTTPQFGLPQYTLADVPQREDFNKAFKTISENMGKGGNVESVNGKAGAVELTAVDVGAADNTLSNVVEIANWNTIRALIGAKSNENLLDNWYFADPIDQRNGYIVPSGTTYYSDTALTTAIGTVSTYTKATYINTTYGSITVSGVTYYVAFGDMARGYTGSEYTIDRWKMTGDSAAVVLDREFITLHGNSSGAYWLQYFENKELYAGKMCTFSALYSDNVFHTVSGVIAEGSPLIITGAPGGWDVVILDGNNLYVQHSANAGRTKSVVAAKLELGDKQTLARQENGNWILNNPPTNKLIELLKCQYFYRLFATESARPKALADYHPPMRANPATGTIDINGVTYYYADANL